MRMLHVMRRHPETIGPDDPLAKAQEMMRVGGFSRLPVVKNGDVIGFLTERDLRAHAGYLEATAVNAAMHAPVVSVNSSATVQEATSVMLRHKIGGLPVIDKGRLVGMVTTSDLLRAFLEILNTAEKAQGRSEAPAN
jgi:acetoin utilization protein AcuB